MQAVEQAGTSISYGTLLHQMHRSLKSMNSGGGGGGGGGGMSSMLGGGGGGGMSSLLGGGGGGGGGMSSLLGAGMKLLGSRGTGGGGGAGLGGLLGGLMQSSNSGGWKKQTPVLSSNEVMPCPAQEFVTVTQKRSPVIKGSPSLHHTTEAADWLRCQYFKVGM